MSQELAIVEQASNPLAEIQNVNRLMESLMKLPHYKRMGEDVVFAIVAKANSLKIDPLYALGGGLYNVKGKIGMSAEAMAAMIRERGHSITKDKSSNDEICILHGKRADNGDTWTCKFSIQDAKKAGIYANMWEKYPPGMCYNRAMSFLARQLFPDIIKGAGYTLEELNEISSSKNYSKLEESEMIVIEPVHENPITEVQAEELGNVLMECDPEYLQNVWKTLKKMIPPITDLKEIPSSIFERMMKAAQNNRTQYQQALAKKDLEEIESKQAS